MIDRTQNQYMPDYVSPPGETLLETLQAIGMSQGELAERTGRPKKTINEIIKGKAAITPETALQLERVLGIPASFWNNRERQYREALARMEERNRLQKEVRWLDKIPVKAMIKLGWIQSCQDEIQQLQEVLNFFGIASPDQWDRLVDNMLVSPIKLSQFIESGSPSKVAIRRFASEVGIAPGIVVGRLQHDGILPHSHCNDLKRRLEWASG